MHGPIKKKYFDIPFFIKHLKVFCVGYFVVYSIYEIKWYDFCIV